MPWIKVGDINIYYQIHGEDYPVLGIAGGNSPPLKYGLPILLKRLLNISNS